MVPPSVILTFIIIDDRTLTHSIRNGPSLIPKLNFRADLKTQCKKRSAIFSSKIKFQNGLSSVVPTFRVDLKIYDKNGRLYFIDNSSMYMYQINIMNTGIFFISAV